MMNFNTKECEYLATNLCKLFISKNDKDYLECESIYLNHFLKSKEYGNDWIDCFTKTVIKILSDKKINPNIISAMINRLEFKIFLNENILFNIKDIIYSNKNLNFDKISSNSKLSFLSENFKQDRFFKYANNFIINKMYLVINDYNKIFNKPELFSFDILFDKLNSSSINGKLFYITETFIFFKIPFSKYSDFYFHFDNKLYIIYEGQNLELDKEKVFLNFIHSNIIYDNDISVCKSNYKLFEKTESSLIIDNISNEENIDYYLIKETIKNNVNFNYNFNYSSNNENLNKYDIFCLILLNITNNKIFSKNIDANLINIFINEMAFQHNINDIINQNYIEKNIVSVFLTLKDYETFIYNSSYTVHYKNHFEKTINLIKPLLILFLKKLYNAVSLKNSNEITIKNSLYSIGIFDTKNREICYKILSDFNLKNNKDFHSYFIEDFEWISSLMNSIQFESIFTIISDLILNNINEDIIIKKITLKYPNYNQKEIKKIILKIKNKIKN